MTNAVPVSDIPISADYTSRDYYSLREDLIKRLSDRVPEWNGTDPADFGVALIEAFAYMGDIVNYYIDRVANENYLATATQRQSIIDLAATLGYVPTGYRAATTNLTLSNTSDTDITLALGTQFTIDIVSEDEIKQLIFSTTEAVTIVANSSATVEAINGEWARYRAENLAQGVNDVAGEWLGVSNGLPDQTFQLSENQVVENTLTVYVQSGDVYEEWERVTSLATYGPNDAVYSVSMDADNFVYITFGDGVSGAIPTDSSSIKVDYLIGGGVLGNIQETAIYEIYSSPGLTSSEVNAISSSLVMASSTGIGGAEPESNDNIRFAAPLFFTSQNRAVTLKDFANLALGVSEVGKTNAVAETRESVTIFAGPDPDPTDPFQFPGYTADPTGSGVLTDGWVSIKEDILTFLTDKTQIGTTVTVAPPAYPKASIEVQYTKFPQYTYDQVETNLKSTLLNQYSYSSSDFASRIYPEDTEFILRQVSGVASVQVKSLYRTGDAASRSILIGEPNEIFVFTEDEMSIKAAEALLSMGMSVGTLTPSFNPSITNYSLSLTNAQSSLVVTPESTSSTAAITVNGTAVASATPSGSIAVAVGISNVLVVVTAEDGVTTKTYTITVNRAAA